MGGSWSSNGELPILPEDLSLPSIQDIDVSAWLYTNGIKRTDHGEF